MRQHVHAFGVAAPAASGVIHYGATSCYVTDNAELILMRDALEILTNKLAKVISNIERFAAKWKGKYKGSSTAFRSVRLLPTPMQPSPRLHTPTFKQHSSSQLESELLHGLKILNSIWNVSSTHKRCSNFAAHKAQLAHARRFWRSSKETPQNAKS